MKTHPNRIHTSALALAALALNLLALESAKAYSFTNTGALNIARYTHTATLLPNGQVLVAAGWNPDIGPVAGSESYDPASGLWTTNGDLVTPSENRTATLLATGKVLVTGGDNFSGALTNAEVYDSASGTWTPTGAMTYPRTWHTATLLQNGKVLVAGGYDFVQGAISPCELYDPVAGTWTNTGALSNTRIEHTATLLANGQVLVVGGDGSGICELYNPVSGQWTTTGSTQVPRQLHTATLLANGQVLVAGGSGDNSAELYDPVTRMWTTTSAMNASRVAPTATWLPNGQVLVAGGYTDSNSTNVFSSTELYDPGSGMWATNVDMISARAQQTATLLPNGNVLMAGGNDGTNAVAIAELYFSPPPPPAPPAPGTWTATGALTNAPYLHTATLLPNGKALICGGSDNSSHAAAGVQLYDPATGAWTSTNAMGKARFGHTATVLPSGKVLAAGGITSYDSFSLVQTVELFNPTNGTWTTTGALKSPRYGHTATLLANGKVLVAAGVGTNGSNVNLTNLYTAELYDPTSGVWTVTGVLSAPHDGPTATLLPNGKVLVVGGATPSGGTSATELYDPASGLWTTMGPMTINRQAHAATLLTNGMVLVAGGETVNGMYIQTVNSAEIYNPATGNWTATGSLQGTHDRHTLTLLPNGLVLLAGTSQYYNPTNTAELYDPASGQWTVAAHMNFPRTQHTATLLPSGKVLAAGGFIATAELYDATAIAVILRNPTMLSDGAFQFAWTNTPGSVNIVLSTTNPALPLANWTVLGGASETSAGQFQCTDTQATNSPRRFYRVRSP